MRERVTYEPPIPSRDIPDSLAFLDTVIALIDATDRDAWWEGPTFRSPCQTKHCVLSHVADQLGMDAMDRFQNEWSTSYVIGAAINDKPSVRYPQPHPKDRVAAYLRNLRNGTEMDVQVSTYETFMHHEQQDSLAAVIHSAICYDSPEECAEENGACRKAARALQNNSVPTLLKTPVRQEWGVLYPSGNVEVYSDEAEARRFSISCNGLRPDLPTLVVRKKISDWETVDA